jgi:hypothetical protein
LDFAEVSVEDEFSIGEFSTYMRKVDSERSSSKIIITRWGLPNMKTSASQKYYM